MKKIIITISVLLGGVTFANAQRGTSQPVTPSNSAHQTQQTNTIQPQRAKKHEKLPAKSAMKSKETTSQMDNATNRELMRSEQKSSEKMRKEVIK